MAFTVETGSGVSGANSYLAVADADTYWGDRVNATSPDGNAWSSASTPDKQGALVEASAYLDATYEWVWNNPPLWQGRVNPLSPLSAYTPLKSEEQGLDWPRNAAYDEETYILQTGVPQKVKDATAQLALQMLDGEALEAQDRGGQIKREKVGSLEVEYMGGATPNKSFPMLDRMLSGLYVRRGGMQRLRRV